MSEPKWPDLTDEQIIKELRRMCLVHKKCRGIRCHEAKRLEELLIQLNPPIEETK